MLPDQQTEGLADQGASAAHTPLERFGDYELIEELARGGMGVVYRARQVGLGREVALKRILTGKFASSEEVQRFLIEARAAAALDHPNIVPVYEVGEVAGQYFFSMKLVTGGSLADAIDRGLPACEGAARTMASIARAVATAHRHGILHLDLKPANILLDEEGRPHVGDFGLARREAEGDTSLARSSMIFGTPSYMSPEQAEGRRSAVTTASDIYGLGAMLYELLCGRPPFVADGALKTIRLLLAEEPAPPGRLRSGIPRDLETICLKCLRKEPERRYRSAEALAEDLERCLRHEPVEARPLGSGERLVRWVRRRPAVAALLAVSLAAAVVVVAGSLWYGARLSRALEEANRQKRRYREQVVETKRERDKAQQATRLAVGQTGTARRRLEQARRAAYATQLLLVENVWRRDPHFALEILIDSARCPLDLRDFLWGHYYRLSARDRFALIGHPRFVWSLAVSPDGQRIVTGGGADSKPRIWSATSGRLLAKLPGHTAAVPAVAFSRDGSLLATGSLDRTVQVWEMKTLRRKAVIRDASDWVGALAFSPDGRTLAIGVVARKNDMPREVLLWDVASSRTRAVLKGHPGPVPALAFSPDGNLLASGSPGGAVILWNPATGKRLRVLAGHRGGVGALAIRPDGRILASADRNDNVVRFWSLPGGHLRSIVKETHQILSMAYSPDGKLLALGVDSEGIKIRSSEDLEQRIVLRGRKDLMTPLALAFLPGGGRVIGAYGNPLKSGPGMAVVWEVEPSPSVSQNLKNVVYSSVTFDRSTQRLVTGRSDGTIELRDRRGELVRTLMHGQPGQRVNALAVAPDGKLLAVGSWSGEFRLIEIASGREVHRDQLNDRLVRSVSFSPDGKRLLTCGNDGMLRLRDPRSGAVLRSVRCQQKILFALAWFPDGQRILTAGDDGMLRIREPAGGQVLSQWRGSRDSIVAAAVSPDGKRIVWTAGSSIHLRDLDRGTTAIVSAKRGKVSRVLFSPDGRTLASVSGGTITFWDPVSGQERNTFRAHDRSINALAFSPDSRLLATAAHDYGLRLWSAVVPADVWTRTR